MREVIPAVLHHQERWDGNGYPARLAGESIPLPARIISAADAYHAIRSDRPYRPGRNHEEALAELSRCAGAQFDPRVVTALVAALEAEPGLQDLFAPGSGRADVGRSWDRSAADRVAAFGTGPASGLDDGQDAIIGAVHGFAGQSLRTHYPNRGAEAG